jgi:hypothetical protein
MEGAFRVCASVGVATLFAHAAVSVAAWAATPANAQPEAVPPGLSEVRGAWMAQGDSLPSAEQLLQRLSKRDDSFIGVELVIAAPSRRHIESLKGHSLLRFVDDDGNPLNDLVISFTADTGGRVSYLKGCLGRYPSMVQLLTMRHLLDEYVRQEDRALSRYIIPTSRYSRLRLRASLEDWIQTPTNMRRYGILRNNCSRLLTRCLGKAGITPDSHEVSFPINIPPYLRKNLLNPYPPVVVPTLRNVRAKIGRAPKSGFASLTDSERLRYALETRDLPVDGLEELAAALSAIPDPVEAYNLSSLPEAVYQACDDPRCAEEAVRAGATVWTPASFSRCVLAQRTEIRDVEKKIKNGDFTVESVRHYRLSTSALEN